MKPYYDEAGITIYHGDCREIDEWRAADAIITDPPYGINHDTDYTRFTKGADAKRSVHAPVHGDTAAFDPETVLSTGCPLIVLWGANCYSGLPPGSWFVWDKRTPGGAKNVMSDAEVGWFSRGHGVYIFEHAWDGFNRATERGTAFHPTQKPVALMRWVLRRATNGHERIADPFMGAGSTLHAAKANGRRAIGIEIEERYCEIAAKRLGQEVLDFGAAS